MKKFLVMAVAILSISCAFAQNRKPVWATLQTPNLRCWECKLRLENYMKRDISQTDAGIIKLTVNMLSGTTRVQYWPDRVSLNYIQTAFNNAGFDADSTKATEDAYKLLPPACKRNEEGGGPKKGKPCHIEPFKD